jgi:hypothetical protein
MWEFMDIKVFTDDNKMAFDWLEEDKDGFVKVCNNFKIPETPEFKPYIP